MAINKNKVNDNALKFIQKGQIKKAIREYEKILAEDPGDVRTLLKKGDLQVRIGEKAQAVETYLSVANAYSQQGFYLKAVAVFKQILKIDDSRIDVNLRLAEEYQNLGVVGDAMSHLQKVAAYYDQQGMSRESLNILRRIVDLEPDNIASRIKLAELYSRESMIPEAVEEFSRATEDLKAANRVEDFIKVAERLIYHDPTNIALIKELANIYLQRGDTKRSLGKLQICFKNDPRDLETLQMLSTAFEDLNQLSKTVSVCKEMAKIYQEMGDEEEMRQVYRRVLEIAPDDPEATQALIGGEVASPPEYSEEAPIPQMTQPAAAPSPYAGYDEEPIEIHPEPVEMEALTLEAAPPMAIEEVEAEHDETREVISRLLTETDVYIKYGLHNKAFEHLNRVFEMDPGNIEAHTKLKDLYLAANQVDHAAQELHTLAHLYLRMGKEGAARESVQSLLSLMPGHPEGTALAAQLGLDMADEPEVAIGDEMDDIDIDLDEPSAPAIEALDPFETGEEDLITSAGTIETQADSSVLEAMAAAADLEYEQASAPTLEMPVVESVVEIPEDEELVSFEDAADDLDAGLEEEEEFDQGEASTRIVEEYDFDSIEKQLEAGEPTAPRGQAQGGGLEEPDFEEPDIESMDEYGSGEETMDIGLMSVDELEQAENEMPHPSPAEAAPEDVAEGETSAAGEELIPFDESEEFPEQEAAPDSGEFDLSEASTRLGIDGDLDGMQAGSSDEYLEVSDEDVMEISSEPERVEEAEAEAETEARDSELADGLEEADFFIQQNLLDEASDILESLKEQHPDHPGVIEKFDQLERMKKGEALQVQPADMEEDFDLAAEIEREAGEEDFAAAPIDDDFQYSVDDVFSEFKKGVQEVVEKEDSATHFDLGIAYKEMGLLDDAIQEFEIASGDQARCASALSMIGLCYVEKGQHSDAINRFKDALHQPGIGKQEETGVYYEIGRAYEELNDLDEMLFYYKKVYKRDAKFRDVAAKLKKYLKGGPKDDGPKKGGPGGPGGPKSTKDKISYM
ncbi:MAG: tetratricopeptide repeat protein [Deltaproteobacteria bacterium]|nr:tetratricopeptide repeat protein [Deltaproteobacteria bacterium]